MVKGSGMIVPLSGSMTPSSGGGKVSKVVRDRKFLTSRAFILDSEQVLSQTQSPYPVGTQFSATTMLFSAESLSTAAKAWIQNYDKYRILLVEVFATLSFNVKDGVGVKNVPVEVYFYEDTDADLTTQTSWIRTSDRLNVGKVILTELAPSQKLISFQPTASFAASSVTSQSPANVVPKKGLYIDALSLAQVHSGLRMFTCCAQPDASGQSYAYQVNLTTRYHIQVTQPI